MYTLSIILSEQRYVDEKKCPHCGKIIQKKCLLKNIQRLPVGYIITNKETEEIIATVYLNNYSKAKRKYGTIENFICRSRGDLANIFSHFRKTYHVE